MPYTKLYHKSCSCLVHALHAVSLSIPSLLPALGSVALTNSVTVCRLKTEHLSCPPLPLSNPTTCCRQPSALSVVCKLSGSLHSCCCQNRPCFHHLTPRTAVLQSVWPSSPGMPCKLCTPHVSLSLTLDSSLGVRCLRHKTCTYVRERLRHAD